MSKLTTIHNAMSHALIVDTVGHIVGGGESLDVEADEITHRLISRGDLVVIDQPDEQPKKRASRQRDVDETKNGD